MCACSAVVAVFSLTTMVRDWRGRKKLRCATKCSASVKKKSTESLQSMMSDGCCTTAASMLNESLNNRLRPNACSVLLMMMTALVLVMAAVT